MQKVLIIKIGYSETLDMEYESRKVSFGDILRTTAILHLYKDDDVTWVTDEVAFPLVKDNPYIKRILPFETITILQLMSEEFDTVINLEKVPGICALADKIKAWKRYGFRFNTKTGKAEAYDRAFEVLAVSSDPNSKKENRKTVQELLFEMVGAKWNGEGYILGYKPATEIKYDVGLNTQVGQKWPTKLWSMQNWDELENMLKKDNLSVTRQEKQGNEILTNLYSYIDWINSCKTIISNDSLGLHIAIALKKKVLGLFGPTPHKEVYFYGNGKAILSEQNLDCIPCYQGTCEKGKNCMKYISTKKVYEEIKSLII